MTDRKDAVAAIEEAARYKTKRKAVQNILARREEKAEELCQKLERGEWYPPHHEKHRIQEGSHKKVREIVKPRFDDEQLVHHMVARQLRPIVTARLCRYAYGSLPGRGTHAAVRAMKRWRDGYGGKRFYVFEGDIKSFYDTVDAELLKAMLGRRIRDKRYLEVLYRVIDGAGPGLPKGFYTSPWLANLYMEGLDSYVTQFLRPDHYLRYMDNLFIFHRNKRALHRMVEQLAAYLERKLHLRLKADWQVYRFEAARKQSGKAKGRAINALGFVIHRDRVGVRKSILKRVRGKARRMHRRGRYTRYDAASMLSRMGVFRHADAYNYYLAHIKPMVNIRKCKRRVAAAAKQEKVRAKNDRLENCAWQSRRHPGGAGHHVQQLHGLRAAEHPAGDGDGGQRRDRRRGGTVGVRAEGVYPGGVHHDACARDTERAAGAEQHRAGYRHAGIGGAP